MTTILKLPNYHPLPSFQNIYLINSLQLKLKSDYPKLYLMYLCLFLQFLHQLHHRALVLHYVRPVAVPRGELVAAPRQREDGRAVEGPHH